MRYEHNGQLICRTPCSCKDAIEQTVILNDDEADFIKRHGVNNFELWKTLSYVQKKAYKHFEKYVEQVYSTCFELFTQHHTDLEFYALMYRNIPLYRLALDAYSMMFFASKKDEIIGYSTKIKKCNSEKARVLKLYCDNKALFPKACKKHLNIDICDVVFINYDFTEEVIRNFENNKIPEVKHVNALSLEDCKAILKAEQKIKGDYKNVLDTSPWMYDGVHYSGQPDFTTLSLESILSYREHIDKFLFENGYLSFNEDMETIERYEKKLLETAWEEIYPLIKKAYSYSAPESYFSSSEMPEKKMPEKNWFSITYSAEKAIDHLNQANKYRLPVLDYFEEQENNMRAERTKEIMNLKINIQALIKKVKTYQDEICQLAETTDSIKIIRNINDALNIYLNRYYEKQYDALWLRNKEFIRKLEADKATVHCFVSFIKGQKLLLKTIEKRKVVSKKNIMGYLCSRIFTNWYEPIKKEKERIAQLEKLAREEAIKQEQERTRRELEQKRREEEARQAQYRYNERNAHPRDKMLDYNKANHIYRVNGKVLDSVTALVTRSFPKFNAEEHAKYTAARNGITVQEVIEMWERKGKESRDWGTLLHEKIEKFYQGVDSAEDPAFSLFKQFANKIALNPYRTEWSVYDYDLGIAGSIDFVDYQNGEYSIYDWKRSDKLIANELPAKANKYGEKGNYPLEHLDNSPYYHYALQLSIYRYILERNYSIKVSHLRLGVFHPSYTKPYLLEMPYLEEEVSKLFGLRSEIIL